MTKEELQKILDDHKLGLSDSTKGQRANLRGADLSNTDLINANLRGAYLIGANLSNTCVFTFSLGAHSGFAHFGDQYEGGSYVKIGCRGLSLVDWLENYKAIGKSNGYTDKQIKDYGDFLKYLAKRKP